MSNGNVKETCNVGTKRAETGNRWRGVKQYGASREAAWAKSKWLSA